MTRVPYIAHLDLDCFFVSVERIKDPSLVGKPVIVGGSPDGRGVVTSASYEARKYGVHSAMPAGRALKLCPSAICVRGHFGEYADYSRRLVKRLEEVAPVVEPASIDEVYMEFTGCESLYHNNLPGFMKDIQAMIREEFSLPCTIALASNKTVAKIAANTVKPEGVITVPHGSEKSFLAPLPVEVIPGVGRVTAEVLQTKGFRTVADLQAASRDHLRKLLGAWGGMLFDTACGLGSEEVSVGRTRKSISHEETFAEDIGDAGQLERILHSLVESVCATLRAHRWKARTITLKLRYADFTTLTRRATSLPTNYDPEVYACVRDLLRRGRQRTMPIRLLGVGLSHFVDESPQELSLFPVSDKREAMLRAIDRLRRRHGKEIVHIGGV